MLKIEYLDENIPVYDITVADNHNFFGNGILVHNCTEIFEPTNEDRTAVCCLSSLNLELYDEWKHTNLIADLITMLDNVLQYFIDNAPDELNRSRESARRERSIGLGAMGLHSLFQRYNIPFDSQLAEDLNEEIFLDIKNKSIAQSRVLALLRGEAPDMEGSGLRHAHLMAIAPNANSSIIADTSPSIEPYHANAFVHRTRAGSFLVKNKYLQKVLKYYNQDTEEVWSSIIANSGSVNHLNFLDELSKNVYKTAIEIDQNYIIKHAAIRQKYICQGQSINLFFNAKVDRSYINKIHLDAWKSGLKSLYYLRTEASSKVEAIATKVIREKLEDSDLECEGCKV